jgi:hypothetical protein
MFAPQRLQVPCYVASTKTLSISCRVTRATVNHRLNMRNVAWTYCSSQEPNWTQADRRKTPLQRRYAFPRLACLSRNRREGRIQLRSKTLHNRDDRNRDARGDEPIFDGRCSRFVLEKGKREILHCKLPFVPRGETHDFQIVSFAVSRPGPQWRLLSKQLRTVFTFSTLAA